MKHTSEEIKNLRTKAEATSEMTAELQQVLAQLEATLLRQEIQKVAEKSTY